MSLLLGLDRLHDRLRRSPLLYRVVLVTRYLFAMAFIPTGLVKLMGLRFTVISPETPIGAFFEAMYQTGAYWRFLGVSQIVAGLLLLVPRLATLGATIFFPIVLNIFVITVALDFKGTPFITGAMLLGATSLLVWDWHRLRGLFTAAPVAPGAIAPDAWVQGLETWWERVAWGVGLAAGLAFWFATRGFVAGRPLVPIALVTGALAALVAVAGWVRTAWRSRASRMPA